MKLNHSAKIAPPPGTTYVVHCHNHSKGAFYCFGQFLSFFGNWRFFRLNYFRGGLNFFRAFTLAEILITLAIIGLVAALTMPTLIANYQKKAQVIQIRKLTNDFVNEIDVLITEEGKTSMRTTSIFKSDEALNNWIKTKFSATPCDSANCFAQTKYKSIDKTEEKEFSCDGKAYLLANSAAVCVNTREEEIVTDVYEYGGNKREEKSVNLYYLDVYADTNGQAKPNLGGRDMFGFTIDEKLQAHYYGYVEEVKSGGLHILGYNPETEFSITNMLFPAAYAVVTHNDATLKAGNSNNTSTENLKGCLSEAFGEYCIELLKENNWVMDYTNAPLLPQQGVQQGGLQIL